MVGIDAVDLEALYDRTVDVVERASDPDTQLVVDDVLLFGSVARGDATPPASDVDLLIVVDRTDGPTLAPDVDRQLRRIADNVEFRAASILSGTPFDAIDAVVTIPRNADQRIETKTTDRGGGKTSPMVRLPEGERL
jgi:predicted nucleotidyltransferase